MKPIVSAAANVVKGIAIFALVTVVVLSVPFFILISAAELGQPKAEFLIGKAYMYGLFIHKNDQEAFKWMTSASNHGNRTAQSKLGVLYAEGRGVSKDMVTAKRLWTDGAKAGFSESQYNLGVLYALGDGTPQDYVQAREWYLKAAQQGHPLAQQQLALLYEEGRGGRKDMKSAAVWYEKLAEQGDIDAQARIGGMYFDGEGVEKNYETAKKWFSKAAQNGNAPAEYGMGLVYTYGPRGVRNCIEAKKFLTNALAHGVSDAKKQFDICPHLAAEDQPPAPFTDDKYLAAVDAAQGIPSKVDWKELRRLYIGSSFARETGALFNLKFRLEAAGKKIGTDNSRASTDEFKQLMRKHYGNIGSHILASNLAEKEPLLAGQINENSEKTAIAGLLEAIISTGDGKTEATAFRTICCEEDQAVVEKYLKAQMPRRIALWNENGNPHWGSTKILLGGQQTDVFFSEDEEYKSNAPVDQGATRRKVAEAKKVNDEKYLPAVAKAEMSPDQTDWHALRDLYAQTNFYSPWVGFILASKLKEFAGAIRAEHRPEDIQVFKKIVDEQYANIVLHRIILNVCEIKQDDFLGCDRSKTAQDGLLKSILQSGDGRSAQTAYKVINNIEEAFIYSYFGLEPRGQALRNENGHAFDVWTLLDTKTGESREMYFNIDVSFAGEEAALADRNVGAGANLASLHPLGHAATNEPQSSDDKLRDQERHWRSFCNAAIKDAGGPDRDITSKHHRLMQSQCVAIAMGKTSNKPIAHVTPDITEEDFALAAKYESAAEAIRKLADQGDLDTLVKLGIASPSIDKNEYLKKFYNLHGIVVAAPGDFPVTLYSNSQVPLPASGAGNIEWLDNDNIIFPANDNDHPIFHFNDKHEDVERKEPVTAVNLNTLKISLNYTKKDLEAAERKRPKYSGSHDSPYQYCYKLIDSDGYACHKLLPASADQHGRVIFDPKAIVIKSDTGQEKTIVNDPPLSFAFQYDPWSETYWITGDDTVYRFDRKFTTVTKETYPKGLWGDVTCEVNHGVGQVPCTWLKTAVRGGYLINQRSLIPNMFEPTWMEKKWNYVINAGGLFLATKDGRAIKIYDGIAPPINGVGDTGFSVSPDGCKVMFVQIDRKVEDRPSGEATTMYYGLEARVGLIDVCGYFSRPH